MTFGVCFFAVIKSQHSYVRAGNADPAARLFSAVRIFCAPENRDLWQVYQRLLAMGSQGAISLLKNFDSQKIFSKIQFCTLFYVCILHIENTLRFGE